MDGAGAVFLEPPEVERRPVAFMGGKAVLGPLLVILAHKLIASDLSDNGGGANAAAEPVPFHHGEAGHRQGLKGKTSVDDDGLWPYGEPLNGKMHGLQRGLEDIDTINFIGVDGGGSKDDVFRGGKPLVQKIELSVAEQLAVRKPGEVHFKRNDGGAGDDGSCERASSGLIDAGDQRAPAFS